jgi:hypothetical protein
VELRYTLLSEKHDIHNVKNHPITSNLFALNFLISLQ